MTFWKRLASVNMVKRRDAAGFRTVRIAVVTDSSTYLPKWLVRKYGIKVVDLQVHNDNGILRTSRPNPQQFQDCYAEIFDSGYERIVSVHLSSTMSGTCDSARMAAKEFPNTVDVIDTRSVAMGTGFAAWAAAERAAYYAEYSQRNRVDVTAAVTDVVLQAEQTAALTPVWFYVHSLDYLRRSGRVKTRSALFGAALAIKPILTVRDGEIELLEKVRTSKRALQQLSDYVVNAVAELPPGTVVDIAVQHSAALEKAKELAARLRLAVPSARHIVVTELGPVIVAHTGPGVVGVAVRS